MAHYYERDKVHAAPAGASRRPVRPGSGRAAAHPTTSQPAAHTAAAHPAARSAASRPAARIDCDTCPIAGRGCGDCMVALLGPVRLRLDAAEQRAVDLLVDGGLVSAQDADEAYAVPDLPDWVVQSWPAVATDNGLLPGVAGVPDVPDGYDRHDGHDGHVRRDGRATG